MNSVLEDKKQGSGFRVRDAELRGLPCRLVAPKQGIAGSGAKAGQWSVVSGLWSWLFALVAAALLLVSLKLPLWQIRFEAPQYRGPEALHIAVHPNALRGDLRELTTLDQYIGVHIPATLPQFKWLPAALIAGAGLGLGASLLRGSARSWALTTVCAVLAAAMLSAALQARVQMRDIGHKRDAKVILAGVRDFTPPFLGSAKIAQFEVTSKFGLGAWLIGSAMALQLAGAWAGKISVRRAAVVCVSRFTFHVSHSALHAARSAVP
jgi:hypothetical protein